MLYIWMLYIPIMEIHCVICSTLSAEATTTRLWHAGIHIHVVDDTLHKFVVNQRIYVYVCTATPFMESFLQNIHYHNYACAILYDSTSTISRQRCQNWVRVLMDRPTPPSISLVSRGGGPTMLPHFNSIRSWLNRLVARSF